MENGDKLAFGLSLPKSIPIADLPKVITENNLNKKHGNFNILPFIVLYNIWCV